MPLLGSSGPAVSGRPVAHVADPNNELEETYVQWTTEALGTIRSLIETLGEGADDADPLLDEIYGISHNIKGMGTSFGYPLMTDIGTSLCSYLRHVKNDRLEVSHDALDVHLKAMDTVFGNRIRGDGGASGKRLNERLASVVAKALG